MERRIRGAFEQLVLLGCLAGIPSVVAAQDDAAQAESTEEADALPAIDPANSPLATDPGSADELFEATVLMVDVSRIDYAELYLAKLLAQPLTDDNLVALRTKYGPAPFLKLAQIEKLNPNAKKLLDRSNAALLKHAANPQLVERLIADLEFADEKGIAAREELISLGTPIVPSLIRVLADPSQAKKHETVVDAILIMRERARSSLLGGLTAPADAVALRTQVITLLGLIEAKDAVPRLWHAAQAANESAGVRLAARTAISRILKITPEAVERMGSDGVAAKLLDAAREHFQQKHTWKTDDQGRVSLWLWNPRRSTVVLNLVSPEVASEFVGLRLAREALDLAPEQRPAQATFLASLLASDLRRVGFDQPLPEGPGTAHDTALGAGSELALSVIAEGINGHRPLVAAAALQVFSQTGTLAQLQLGANQKSIVVAALDYPDPRVQFAAATAILQIDPTQSFRGSSRVVEILKRTLASDGKAHAVVGEVSTDRAALLTGVLRELGYEPLVFKSGKEAFAAAASRSDVDLVVLHPNIIRWPLTDTIANLRADSRTANIPIVIHGPQELTARMERKARNLHLVSFSSAVETTNDFDLQLTPLLRKIKNVSMTAQERRAQRVAAVQWLAHIAKGRRTKVFDIRSAETELLAALNDAELAAPALDALAEIPSAASQDRLAVVTLDVQAPVALRQSAAAKLAFHIQRFGLLLKQPALDGLHAAWQNDREPAELRTAIGGVIGSLKPDAILAGKRLRQQPSK